MTVPDEGQVLDPGLGCLDYFVIPSEARNPGLCWRVQKPRSLSLFGMTNAVSGRQKRQSSPQGVPRSLKCFVTTC